MILLEVFDSLVDAAAAYYTSFASVGIVIYLIRTRQGYRSLPEAINERYGSMATLAFGLAVLFRLYQEVWSNALVVAGFYGDVVRIASLCWQTACSCCCCDAQVTQSHHGSPLQGICLCSPQAATPTVSSIMPLTPFTSKHAELKTCTSASQQSALAEAHLPVQHTKEWWLGACLSTAIPVIYSFTGGMRASLVTDVAQSVTCVGFLVALIIVLGVNAPASFGSWNPAGMHTEKSEQQSDIV